MKKLHAISGLALAAGLALAGCASKTPMHDASAMPGRGDMPARGGMSSSAQMQGEAGMPMRGAAPVTVGGAPMYASRDIVDNAVNSKDHTTLVAAVKAAGLVDTLKGAGPYTVFAPTDAAFAKLPAGTVDNLLRAENRPALTKVLTYHVVPGRIDAASLQRQIAAGGGRATLKTAAGGTLVATSSGGKVMVADSAGGTAVVTIADVMQSNGVIHVVDKVLLPPM